MCIRNTKLVKQAAVALVILTLGVLPSLAQEGAPTKQPDKLVEQAEEVILVAEKHKKELQQKIAQLEKEAAQEGSKPAMAPIQWQKAQTRLRIIENYLQLQKTQLMPALKERRYSVALAHVSKITPTLSPGLSLSHGFPQPVMELHMNLVKEISALAQTELEQIKKETADFGNRLGSLLIAARDAQQLDSAIKEIAKRQNKLTSQPGMPHHNLRDELSQMRNMVTTWQDYLGYLKHGNRDRARNALNQIKGYVVRTPIINRSKILELEAKLEGQSGSDNIPDSLSVASITKRYPKIADLKKVETESALLMKNKSSNYAAQKLHQAARKLQEIDQLTQTGSIAQAIAGLNTLSKPSEVDLWFSEITQELRHRIFIKTIPKELRAKVADMTMEQSIEAVAKHLNEKKEWYELWEFLKFTQDALFSRNTSYLRGMVWYSNDLKSTESYLSARNLERAGEYYTALTSYRSILKKSGRYGPYEETQQAIQNLRKTKAKEIAEAEKKETEMRHSMFALMRHRGHPGMGGQMNKETQEASIEDILAKKLPLYLNMHLKKLEEGKKAPKQQTPKPGSISAPKSKAP